MKPRTIRRRIINELDSNGWLVARHVVNRETNKFYITSRREVDEDGKEIPGRVQICHLDKSRFANDPALSKAPDAQDEEDPEMQA